MRKIAHIINPVDLGHTSDLAIAQPIVFEAMRRAQRSAEHVVDVELCTTQYPEDHGVIPEGFTVLPDLDRSVLDVQDFEHKRKLPFLGDILNRVAENTDAEYVVYTNTDITPMLHFYETINALIDQGTDAFIINRRTISKRFDRIDQLPEMYGVIGKKHLGYDCFVFKREAIKNYELDGVIIGAPPIGVILMVNLFCFADNFRLLRDAHLTFHIGDDRAWNSPASVTFGTYNRKISRQAMDKLFARFGPFNSSHPIWPYLDLLYPPWINASLPARIIRRLSHIWSDRVAVHVDPCWPCGREDLS